MQSERWTQALLKRLVTSRLGSGSVDRLARSCDGHIVSSGQQDHSSTIIAPAMCSHSMRVSISQFSCPEEVHESSFAESCVEYHDRCASWSDPSDSCTVAGEDIRLQEFFPTDATFVNAKVKELFFLREEDANTKVETRLHNLQKLSIYV